VGEASAAGDKRFSQLRQTISDPLTTILGASELLLSGREKLEAESERYARLIQKMTERIKDSINSETESTYNQADKVS
jgi:signal transduction histidine kinase